MKRCRHFGPAERSPCCHPHAPRLVTAAGKAGQRKRQESRAGARLQCAVPQLTAVVQSPRHYSQLALLRARRRYGHHRAVAGRWSAKRVPCSLGRNTHVPTMVGRVGRVGAQVARLEEIRKSQHYSILYCIKSLSRVRLRICSKSASE